MSLKRTLYFPYYQYLELIHTLYSLYFGFYNKHDPIIKPIELCFIFNNQYMIPNIFIHIIFQFKK
jgi:hypothetical protein